MTATFDADALAYRIDGRQVAALTERGACDALIREAGANIRVLADRMQRGELSVLEWYQAMQREVKLAQMASYALARGGIEVVTDWSRCEALIAQQFNGVAGQGIGKFPGLRAMARDVVNGRYGEAGALSEGFLRRAGMYADAGRGNFENERMQLARENGRMEGCRVSAAVENCPTCARENGVWKPLDEVVEIGNSECGSRCFCIVQTR